MMDGFREHLVIWRGEVEHVLRVLAIPVCSNLSKTRSNQPSTQIQDHAANGCVASSTQAHTYRHDRNGRRGCVKAAISAGAKRGEHGISARRRN